MSDVRNAPIASRRWLGLVSLVTLLAMAWDTSPAATDERLRLLNPEEQALANRMTAFIERMQEKHGARVAELNGGISFETLERETEDSHYFVRVARGPVIEKVGMKVAVGKKQQPGR